MTTSFLPFAMPDVGQQEIEAIVAAIRSGWLTSGPHVREFEEAFAKSIASDVEAVAVNSATAGLHLALEAAGVGAGDEVLVPTWTFTATAEVVRYLRAEPILVDVDPQTLNIDFEHARTLISSRTRAVMPVHFGGYPIGHAAIAAFAGEHGLIVVEDAAHAFPAGVDGVAVGAGASEATVFSFYATKTITTGEGGMVVTRDPELAQRVRTMRLHGISRDVFDRYRSNTPSWRYEVIAPGFKYNLTDPAAAMGLVQLERASTIRQRRAYIARQYDEALAALPFQLPATPDPNILHSWHLYVIRTNENLGRDEVIQGLAELGIGTSVHFIPLHLHPYWRSRGTYHDGDLPVATAEFDRVISLPIYSAMTDDDVARVIRAVEAVAG